MGRRISIWKYIDKYLLVLFLLLLIGGYLTIYSSSYDGLDVGNFWATSSGKQLIWVIISLIVGSIVLLVEGKQNKGLIDLSQSSDMQNIYAITLIAFGFIAR